MNRIKILKTLIENKNLDGNEEENLERYCEAFEQLSDSMFQSLDITTEEMRLIVRSFSNKENHPYFLDMLEDAILLHLDKTNEYEAFFEEVGKNPEGFMESLSIIYGIWVYHKDLIPLIKKHIKDIDKEILMYSLEDYGYQYDEEFKRVFM